MLYLVAMSRFLLGAFNVGVQGKFLAPRHQVLKKPKDGKKATACGVDLRP